MTKDLAGKETWDNIWQFNDMPSLFDPRNRSYKNTVNLRMHDYFTQAFASMDTKGKSLLEVGAARSFWLPYFAKEFGFDVVGLDYSEIGCRQTEEIFSKANVKGKMVHADMFAPPPEMLNAFDVVFTVGVIEHFTDTVHAVKSVANFLKSGGIMITQIPNMVGMVGGLQKALDRNIYDMHILINREQLRSFHEQAGLRIVSCDYFMFTQFGVANMHKTDRTSSTYGIKHFTHQQLQRLSKVFWLIENRIGKFPTNRLTSPYLMCTAVKP